MNRHPDAKKTKSMKRDTTRMNSAVDTGSTI